MKRMGTRLFMLNAQLYLNSIAYFYYDIRMRVQMLVCAKRVIALPIYTNMIFVL